LIVEELATLPAASVALAWSEWEPFATLRESQLNEYGDDVSELTTAPSSNRVVDATPDPESEALTLTVTVPAIVAPDAGLEIETDGAAESAF
jgi:hypothetical protein